MELMKLLYFVPAASIVWLHNLFQILQHLIGVTNRAHTDLVGILRRLINDVLRLCVRLIDQLLGLLHRCLHDFALTDNLLCLRVRVCNNRVCLCLCILKDRILIVMIF